MVDWQLVSFVKASEVRKKILRNLREGQQTPTGLKNRCGETMPRISSVLKELEKYGLIKNLTPNVRKGKIFKITELGKEILEKVEKMEG